MYIPVGISGCGKSSLIQKWDVLKNVVNIEPDQIRKEYCGSVSDQSKNAAVFELFNHFEQREMSYGARDVYSNQMHLWFQGMKEECELATQYGYEPVFIIFEDSSDWKVCESRVEKALQKGEDRSVTAGIIGRSGKPLIQEMSERFCELVESNEFIELTQNYKRFYIKNDLIWESV